jgi:hypothetical protein
MRLRHWSPLKYTTAFLSSSFSRLSIHAIFLGVACKVALIATFHTLLDFLKRGLTFIFSVGLFQMYFLVTFLVLAYSTDRIWGENGTMSTDGGVLVENISDSSWGGHYYWYFFASAASCMVGAVIFGIVCKRITKVKAVVAFLPNSLFLIGTIAAVIVLRYIDKQDIFESKEIPFLVANALLLPVGNFLLYHVSRLSSDTLVSKVKFRKIHFLWLTLPYGLYLVGFTYALSVHAIFTWVDIKSAFYDRFDFSLKHFLRDLLNRLTVVGQIFTDLIQIIIDFLIGLALKIWKYPLEYTIKYLNGDFLQNQKKLKSWFMIFGMLVLGLPVAAGVEILCYYLLLFIDKIF